MLRAQCQDVLGILPLMGDGEKITAKNNFSNQHFCLLSQ